MSRHLRPLTADEREELEETGDVWAECPSFPGYTASLSGQIKSWWDDRFPDGRLLLPFYRTNAIDKSGRRVSKTPAQFVADAFMVPKPTTAHTLVRLDKDRTNNRADNLEWESRSEMMKRTVAEGRHAHANKTHCPRGHLLSGPNMRRTASGSRACVTCSNAAWTAARLRRVARRKGESYDHITTDWVIAHRLPKEDAA